MTEFDNHRSKGITNALKLMDDLKRIHYECDEIYDYKSFTTFEQFNEVAAKISGNISKTILVASAIQNTQKFPNGYTRNEATIVGLMTKISKDFKRVHNAFCDDDSEVSAVFDRMLIESGTRLRHLIQSDESERTNFRKSSYRSRVGAMVEMETFTPPPQMLNSKTRLKESILSKLKDDGFVYDELKTMNSSDWSKLNKDFRALQKDFDKRNVYSLTYGISSDKIHGSWQELIEHHLKEKDGFLIPEYSMFPVDPRFISPIANLCLDFLVEYLKWTEADVEAFFMLISDLKRVNAILTSEFEKFFHKWHTEELKNEQDRDST